MTKKELDQLYNTALSYHIGKGGEEVNIMLAMDYYDEYLENATEKHLHFLDAHYGSADICKQMGDGCYKSDMKEEGQEWYDMALKHYETILVKYNNIPFNNRILAEVQYDKLRKEIEKKNKKSFLQRIFGK